MDNNLKHYGIPGQKWGIRRFQNEDGTSKNGSKKKSSGSKEKTPKKILSPEEKKARIKRGLGITGKILGVVGTLVAADYVMAKVTKDVTLFETIDGLISLNKMKI